MPIKSAITAPMTQLSPKQIQDIAARSTCFYTQPEVDAAIGRMAQAISQELAGTNPLLLCVVIGGIVILGNLLPRLNFPLEVDYVHATRYRKTLQGGDIHWRAEPTCSLEGRKVLIVDDILDSGLTLIEIVSYCENKLAEKVYTAVLVDKQKPREADGLSVADFTGLYVEDRYVYGYGMDYKGYLRNAAGIYAAPED